jgi:CBS domain-containing protein
MSLERFCRKPVVTASPNQSLHEAALNMRDHHVGAIVVVEDGRPIGILTDRDLVMRAIVERRDAATTLVKDVMSRSPTVVHSDQKIDDAIIAVRQAGVRRLPIVDATGKVVGLIALDDLVVLMAGELSVAVAAVQSNRGP